jgi:hypothetical protein
MPAINFPGNDGLNPPADLAEYSNNQVTWRFSSADNSWTVITTADPGVDNGNTALGDTMVKLIRVGTQNQLTPAVNFKHDVTTGTLSIKGITTNTLFNLINSSGTTVNSFNKSGVLTGPSVIYRQASQPSLTADHTGVLWVDTDTSELAVYNGSTWDVIGTGVTLTTSQVISGSKTFSSNVLLSSDAFIAGSGTSKSIVLKPTAANNAWVTALTLTSTTSTFASGNAVDFDTIGANVSTVLVNMSTAQTIAGAKTFSGISTFNNQINFNGASGTSLMYTDSSNTGTDSSSDLVIKANSHDSTRSIKMAKMSSGDGVGTAGITLRPRNTTGNGRLHVDGNTYIDGSLSVTGTIFGATSSRTVSKGCLRATSGVAPLLTTAPTTLGPLNFVFDEVGSPRSNSFCQVDNTGTTPISFYYRNEQQRTVNATPGTTSYTERFITMAAGTTFYLLPGKNGTSGYNGTPSVNTLLGNSVTSFEVDNAAEAGPVTITFTLA